VPVEASAVIEQVDANTSSYFLFEVKLSDRLVFPTNIRRGQLGRPRGYTAVCTVVKLLIILKKQNLVPVYFVYP
jgi:hypothetical protein